jgi:hypothetical protein
MLFRPLFFVHVEICDAFSLRRLRVLLRQLDPLHPVPHAYMVGEGHSEAVKRGAPPPPTPRQDRRAEAQAPPPHTTRQSVPLMTLHHLLHVFPCFAPCAGRDSHSTLNLLQATCSSDPAHAPATAARWRSWCGPLARSPRRD